jgi:hypothetical protein
MSANEGDLQIEDDLAKGTRLGPIILAYMPNIWYSTENLEGAQVQDFFTVEEELRTRKGRTILGFSYCPAYPESHGSRRSE